MTKISQIIARLQSFCMGLILSTALLLCLQNSAFANYYYTPIDGDKQAVVVYTYFQIDEDAFPDASLSFETFSRHIDLIKSENLNVISLDDIEDHYKRKNKNNTPSIALTFDTGHNSIMADAVPLLLKEKIPFTIFISPGEIDQGLPYLIQWNELKKLARNPLVTIGIHNANYKYSDAYENQTAFEQSVLSAITRYKEVLGTTPKLYAYPYGDQDAALAELLRKNGIEYAFGLQSGVLYKDCPAYNVPRFTMTDNIGSAQRFVDTAFNLPLPTFDSIPEDTVLERTPDSFSFSIPKNLQDHISSLQCFHSGLGRIDTEIIGDERVHIPVANLGELSGRTRVNCTINAGYDEAIDRQRWRWHGILLRVTQP